MPNPKQITIKLSEDLYSKILERAGQEKMTVSDFLISSAIPEYKKSILTLDKALTALDGISPGEVFCLQELFTQSDWDKTTNGSHISMGRMFFEAYKHNRYELAKKVLFKGKNSANLAYYEKL